MRSKKLREGPTERIETLGKKLEKHFSLYVLVGYSLEDENKGSPIWFFHGNPIDAGALLQWAYDDIKNRLVAELKNKEKNNDLRICGLSSGACDEECSGDSGRQLSCDGGSSQDNP